MGLALPGATQSKIICVWATENPKTTLWWGKCFHLKREFCKVLCNIVGCYVKTGILEFRYSLCSFGHSDPHAFLSPNSFFISMAYWWRWVPQTHQSCQVLVTAQHFLVNCPQCHTAWQQVFSSVSAWSCNPSQSVSSSCSLSTNSFMMAISSLSGGFPLM